MKKRLLFSAAGLILLLVALVMAAAMNLRPLIEASSGKVVAALQGKTLAGMRVESLTLPPPMVDLTAMTIIWQPVAARITMTQGNEFLAGKTLTVTMDALTARAVAPFSGAFVVTANALSIQTSSPGTSPSQSPADEMTALSHGHLTVPVRFGLWPPADIRPQVEALARDLLALVETGRTTVPLAFSAISSFHINNEVVKAELSVQRKGADSLLLMNKESLRVISWIMEEKLTDPEVELLSSNPIKTPRLLRIRDEAQEEARQAHQEQAFIPEDAYRHVLWSYLLTEAYGPKFAKEVTDAHELGLTDNSEAEHRMDYTNNATGRRYAVSKVKRADIIGLLLNDPGVAVEAEGQRAP